MAGISSLCFLGACMGTIASNASLLVPAAAAAAFGGFLYSRWAQDVRRPRITQHFQGQRHVLLAVISVSHIIHSVVGGQVEAEMVPFPCSGNDVKLGAISLTLKLVESRLSCALNLF